MNYSRSWVDSFIAIFAREDSANRETSRTTKMFQWRSWRLTIFIWSLALIFSPHATAEWVQRSISPIDQTVSAATWVSDGTVLAVSAKSSGYIYRSIDYGVTWAEVGASLTKSSIYNIASKSINSSSFAYAPDDSGRIFRSIDYGLTWTQVATQASQLNSATIGANGYVFVGGAASSVYRSLVSSASSSWTSVFLSTTQNFGTVYGIATLDGNQVIATTSLSRIYFSRNGGSTWARSANIVTGGTTSNTAAGILYCVTFANATVAYAAGVGGIIYKSYGAGRTWAQLTSPVSSDIRYQALSVLSVDTVYISSEGGALYASFNGGSSWALQFTASAGLNSVSMLSTTRGVAGGSSGLGIFALVPSKLQVHSLGWNLCALI